MSTDREGCCNLKACALGDEIRNTVKISHTSKLWTKKLFLQGTVMKIHVKHIKSDTVIDFLFFTLFKGQSSYIKNNGVMRERITGEEGVFI